jgi:hypothetical protein
MQSLCRPQQECGGESQADTVENAFRRRQQQVCGGVEERWRRGRPARQKVERRRAAQ